MWEALKPDGFAIGLAVLGLIFVLLPLTIVPGLVAILLAATYWIIMAATEVVQRLHRKR